MVFPELSLSAYSIDDLLFQDAVLDAVEAQIERLVAASENLRSVFVVGAPLRRQGRLYNCAVAIHRGRVLGVVPKMFLPNYREFYERRHFTSGEGVRGGSITVAGHEAPFGSDLIFAAIGSRRVHVPHRDLRGSLGAAAAERGGGGGRRGNPAQPVGQQHRDRQGADAAAACARRNRRAASRPTPIRRPGSASRRPTSPGTARPASSRSASRCARPSASAPARRSRSPMSMSAASARSACAPTPSATMRGCSARTHRPFRRIEFDFAPPAGRLDLRRGRALPVRAVRPGDAARQLLRGLQHPGAGAGAAAAGDRARRSS